jgi:hypothetical protein
MMNHKAMSGAEEAAIAAFIRTKGVTRCPTACVTTTRLATVTAADRAALERYARAREQSRHARAVESERLLFGAPPTPTEH